ncbi:MAG: hypothetical protein ABSC18_15055 [Verrucomicrobiota bacterium]|jgi:DNA-directed RNA polymerase subunit RPC12/RpoP
MSDFKFACPSCGQRIAANDDYVGHHINCPTCQKEIVVPANPATPSSLGVTVPGALPPPAPPKVTRLGVSALASPQEHTSAPVPSAEQQGSAAFRAHVARKPKKSYSGLIAGVTAVVLIGLSAYINRATLAAKWKAFRGPSAAEIAATNRPAPPPPAPELAPSEIMQKVVEVYKEIPSFSSTGKATAILDTSAVNPTRGARGTRGPVTVSADLELKMSKPLNFRIDMTLPTATSNTTTTGWSTGNGDYIQANNRRTKLPSHDGLFSSLTLPSSAGVNVGVGEIVRLFIDDTSEGLAKDGLEWSRQRDERIEGQPCYVLAGNVRLQNVLVWVNRKTFLIPQIQVKLDGKSGLADLDDAKIKETLKAQNNGKDPSPLQITIFKNMQKTTGTVTETYSGIKTNVTLAMADFQPPAPVAPVAKAPAAAAPGQGGVGGYGGGMGGGGYGGGGGMGGGGGGGRRGR